MDEKAKREVVVEEYLSGGVTMREVARKHGVSVSRVHRWVEARRGRESVKKAVLKRAEKSLYEEEGLSDVPEDVETLRRELREARLYAKLLNAMIDIAEDEFGVEIRKKRGARRS